VPIVGLHATRLRYFLVLADEGHVGRAAIRLGITQPSLSQQIRRLEREIGVELFRRHPKGVALTDPGVVLEREARPAFDALVAAVRAAQQAEPGQPLRIAVPNEAFARHPAVVALLELAHRTLGGCEVSFVSALTVEAIAAVRAGRVDVAFIYDPLDDTDMGAVPAFTDAPAVMLPADHILAEQRELSIEALAPYPILWWERDALPGTHDALVAACRRAGFEPRLIDVPDMPGLLGSMLAQGAGVSVISEFVAKSMADPGVVWRPLIRPRVILNGLMIWSRLTPTPVARKVVVALEAAASGSSGG
jgi:DNA-binding transcriptional LysR family regulator